MGLAETIQSLVLTTFDSIGNLASAATFHKITPGARNTTTGDVAITEVDTAIPKAILTKYTAQELFLMPVLKTDRKIIFPGKGFSETPTTDDKITLGGVKYQIVNVSRDPASASWVLQVR